MKIGLIGFEFNSANKGCEALTYSLISILKNISYIEKDSIIYNFSGTGLGVIPKEFTKFKFIEVKPTLKDMTFKYIRSLLSCDIIFDVTMGDSFSDIYSENYYNYLIRQKKLAEFLCSNYILLPQTYGPFNTKKSERKAIKVLKKAKKIYCRDELSKEILENKFNIKNIELASDMAFVLPYNSNIYSLEQNTKKKLGINVSGLLYKGGFNSSNQFNLGLDYKNYIEKIIEYFSNNAQYEIHLIPHVIDLSENSNDDDYKTCKMLQQKYKNCILAPAFNTPIEAKSYISNMNIFIGSRMHSTIAAFSSGVITIPVSYSRKFEGLFNSLNYKYVINGKNEDTNSAIEKTIDYVLNFDKLQNKQKQSLNIIEEKKAIFIDSINNEIKKIGENHEL